MALQRVLAYYVYLAMCKKIIDNCKKPIKKPIICGRWRNAMEKKKRGKKNTNAKKKKSTGT